MDKYVTIETIDNQKLQGFLEFCRITIVYKHDIKKITIHNATPAPKNDCKGSANK